MDLKYFSMLTLTVRVTGWPAIWGMPPVAVMVRTLGSTPRLVVMVPWMVPVRSPTASLVGTMVPFPASSMATIPPVTPYG